jgi:cbb3-type cytochrome oxidase subunit 1
MYLGGICLMAYNMFKTIAVGKPVSDPVPAALAHA